MGSEVDQTSVQYRFPSFRSQRCQLSPRVSPRNIFPGIFVGFFNYCTAFSVDISFYSLLENSFPGSYLDGASKPFPVVSKSYCNGLNSEKQTAYTAGCHFDVFDLV